jgi:hypothetical protein
MSIIITRTPSGGFMLAETGQREAGLADTSTPGSEAELKAELKKRGITDKAIQQAIRELTTGKNSLIL